MEGIKVQHQDGVATLTMAMPGKVNKIGAPFLEALAAAVDSALATEGLRGIILTSGHRDFCAGADLDMIYLQRDPAPLMQAVQQLHATFRKLETSGVPVVAAINGSALGGGYELALACHHRVALADPRIQLGLVEVTLGVIPGGGGTQRLPWIIGLQAALEHMAQGSPVRAHKARAAGLIDDTAADPQELLAKARQWIQDNPKPAQPWDQKRWSWPGGVRPGTAQATQLFVGASAFLYKKTAGAFAAPEAVIRAVSEGTRLQFDRALEVEARLFVSLVIGDQAKDMIRTLWYHRRAAEALGTGHEHGFQKVAVLGAGMMGAGLGFLAAKAGCQVVLKDIQAAQLDAARAHCQAQAARLRHLSTQEQEAILGRIHYSLENRDIEGSDLVIEAIVENLQIKHKVTAELQPLLAPGAIWASNTSAIPIAMLAEPFADKSRFVGMHFFSPVEKMPLLEVIQPPGCSQETVQRALALGKALGKTNILVKDGYGFFTTRLFAAYLLEGCQLVAEGHDAALIEHAARTAGMVMPPLKVFDEVTLTLGLHAFDTREAVTGEGWQMKGLELVRALVAQGRTGRAVGAGFYDWEARTTWPGLKALVQGPAPAQTGLAHLKERLMVAQAAEVARVLADGVILHHRDVEVGAILGLGFAPNTGGPLAWMDRQGLPHLVTRMQELAREHGPRYAPTPELVQMAQRGQRFWPEGQLP